MTFKVLNRVFINYERSKEIWNIKLGINIFTSLFLNIKIFTIIAISNIKVQAMEWFGDTKITDFGNMSINIYIYCNN